jgi:hypothetical protein
MGHVDHEALDDGPDDDHKEQGRYYLNGADLPRRDCFRICDHSLDSHNPPPRIRASSALMFDLAHRAHGPMFCGS